MITLKRTVIGLLTALMICAVTACGDSDGLMTGSGFELPALTSDESEPMGQVMEIIDQYGQYMDKIVKTEAEPSDYSYLDTLLRENSELMEKLYEIGVFGDMSWYDRVFEYKHFEKMENRNNEYLVEIREQRDYYIGIFEEWYYEFYVVINSPDDYYIRDIVPDFIDVWGSVPNFDVGQGIENALTPDTTSRSTAQSTTRATAAAAKKRFIPAGRKAGPS